MLDNAEAEHAPAVHLSAAQAPIGSGLLESIAFDNVFTGGQLPDLVIMGMIIYEEFASGYHKASPLNFLHFHVRRVEFKKISTTYPHGNYKHNWANGNNI